MPDARKGQQLGPLPVHPGLEWFKLSPEVRHGDVAAPLFDKALLRALRTDREQEVGARHARLDRLAQRPCGDTAAIAKALDRIHHDNRDVLDQVGVLKPVIHHDAIDLVTAFLLRCGQKRARACRAVARYPGRAKGRRQERFVANIGGGMGARVYLVRAAQRAAMAARQDHRLFVHSMQMGHHRKHGRGLAGAACVDVADTDHRHRRAPALALRQPLPGGARIKCAERCQKARLEAGPLAGPEPECGCFHRFASSKSSRSSNRSRMLSVTAAPFDATSHAACAMVAA